ncbi:MAG TPA: TolC family protein [Ignavibacteriaceae bacterium]|nr:TolC family protein [Ignavibacteriaceae bacterium]
MRSLISLLCILCFTTVSFGQKTLSLDQAIQIALQKNTTLQRAENNLNNSESSVKVAYGNFLPSINASTSWSWNRSVDDQPRTVLIGGSPIVVSGRTSETRSYGAGVNANWTLFDGLSNFATLSQSNDNLESARLQLENLKQNIVYQTISLYYAVINAEQLLKVQEDNLKWNKRNLETITERNKLGAVTLADVYSQQVKTGNAELALINANNTFETAKSNLLSYLALDVLEDYSFTDSLTEQEKSILNMDLTSDYRDLSGLVAKALSNRADYKSAQYDLESASNGITIARSGHLPRLSGNISYSLSANEFKNLSDSRSTSVGLTLSLPIFSGFRTSNQVQIAEVNEMNSQLALNDLERTIKQDIQKAYLDLQAAQKSLEVNKTNVTAAEQNRKIQEERYSLGSSTLLDVLIANSDYTTARTNLINAQFSYIQLSQQLKYLLGELNYKKYE